MLNDVRVRAFGVSIHAPVRERLLLLEVKWMLDVSIHAPVRERRNASQLIFALRGFNSRSRKGATR